MTYIVGLTFLTLNICYIVLKHVLFAVDDIKKGMKVSCGKGREKKVDC